MKLISMTDFLLQENKDLSLKNSFRQCINYAIFLKQPLKLEMFVPCDENGNVLEEPINYSAYEVKMSGKDFRFNFIDCQEYEQSKEKVLFEGFQIATNKEGEKVILGDYTCLKVSDLENGDVEDLVKYVHIKLTQNAIKRIFG
jgi:hypothetical protein